MSANNIYDDHSSENDSECQDRNLKYELIDVGDKLKVKYGKGKLQKVYEAKVNKMETNSAGKTKYFVHYTGWNNRYDEWITRSRIIEIIKDDVSKKKDKKKDEDDEKEREKEKSLHLNFACVNKQQNFANQTGTGSKQNNCEQQQHKQQQQFYQANNRQRRKQRQAELSLALTKQTTFR